MTKPRKRFQIHLSTAVIMMLVAGGLIWANTQFVLIEEDKRYPLSATTYWRFGWPNPSYIWGSERVWEQSESAWVFDERFVAWKRESTMNLMIATGILSTTYFLCEWLIRRRAARKVS